MEPEMILGREPQYTGASCFWRASLPCSSAMLPKSSLHGGDGAEGKYTDSEMLPALYVLYLERHSNIFQGYPERVHDSFLQYKQERVSNKLL